MTILASMFRWGGILGGIGFLIGFVGPIVFLPEANQGPLLGIFITGPGGFVLGLIVGLIKAMTPSPSKRAWTAMAGG